MIDDNEYSSSSIIIYHHLSLTLMYIPVRVRQRNINCDRQGLSATDNHQKNNSHFFYSHNYPLTQLSVITYLLYFPFLMLPFIVLGFLWRTLGCTTASSSSFTSTSSSPELSSRTSSSLLTHNIEFKFRFNIFIHFSGEIFFYRPKVKFVGQVTLSIKFDLGSIE